MHKGEDAEVNLGSEKHSDGLRLGTSLCGWKRAWREIWFEEFPLLFSGEFVCIFAVYLGFS